MPLPQLRSPLARAVAPVLGGLAFFVVLGLMTWGVAAFMSGDNERTEALFPKTQDFSNVEGISETIADDGPLLIPGLNEERYLVLNHTGDDPARGWAVYWAYPADRDSDCPVSRVREAETKPLVDCEGRRLDVTALEPPTGVSLFVTDGKTLSIDLQEAFRLEAAGSE